ncbi:MAG: ParB/RepB/Spo0J family partition protein [Clostridia bacterium]|nr:ParB/RepB/Spo0J family partition protein [Clostridia bacterium]
MKGLQRLTEIPVRLIDLPQTAAQKSGDRYELEMLKNSIAAGGLLKPITVSRLSDGRYCLVSGYRRLQACKELGYTSIACLEVSDSPAGLTLRALIDSVQHRQLNMFEQAEAIADFRAKTQMEDRALAAVLGIGELELSEQLRLLELDKKHREILLSAHADRAQVLKIIGLPRLQRTDAVKYMVTADKNKQTSGRIVHPNFHSVGDIRLFLNSFNRIVSSMQRAGYLTSVAQRETKNHYAYTIKISKSPQMRLPEIAGN